MTALNITKINCDCGMDNELIKVGGVLCYNAAKHGNDSAADNKCFNCRGPLVKPAGKKEQTTDDGRRTTAKKAEPKEKPIDKMNMTELQAKTKEIGLEVNGDETMIVLAQLIKARILPDEPAADGASETGAAVKLLADMTAAELRAFAAPEGIKVHPRAGVAKCLEAIGDHYTALAELYEAQIPEGSTVDQIRAIAEQAAAEAELKELKAEAEALNIEVDTEATAQELREAIAAVQNQK